MIRLVKSQNYPVADQPRRFLGYVLLYCTHGSMDVRVDDKDLQILPGEVLTITSGQVHFLKNRTSSQGYILEFTLDFFCKDDNDIELIFHNGLFCHFDLNEVIAIRNKELIVIQLDFIENELKLQPYQYLISVHARIELILVEINRSKVFRGEEIYKPDALFLKFLEFIRHNFRHNFTLAEIADKLETTEAKLNEQSRLHTGKTAQNVVYSLQISEAKRLLLYQPLTIKEIAFELGFNDPFYFSNFFKKHALLSPKAYKKNVMP